MAMVRYRENELPPLTPERETELKALMERPDSEIDFSDMPELDDDFFKNAIPGRFYKPTKKHMSLRIDSDVVAWFQRQGKGYQSRLNAILREAMLRERGIN
ncbi:MAG: BrnA antitoxin family protein [Holophagales bacterium]|nr:BrnA antitoxin family protein [Holophagales bacterium]